MRLYTDEEIESFDEINLIDMLKKKKDFSVEKSISLTKPDLQNLLKKYEKEQGTLFSGIMVLVSQTTVTLWWWYCVCMTMGPL